MSGRLAAVTVTVTVELPVPVPDYLHSVAWAEVSPGTCEACGAEHEPGQTLVGWEPGNPGHRVYHCASCGHVTKVPASQIRLRQVPDRPRRRK